MKLLLTGGTGFLGRAVLAEIARRNHDYQAGIQVRNLTRQPDLPPPHYLYDPNSVFGLTEAVEEWLPDVVIHLAAKSTIKEDHNPCGITESNVLFTHRLLHSLPEGCRFVFASSATVYGKNASRSYPVDECAPFAPDSAYAATKVAGEALVAAYTSMGRVRGISLRLVANAGPGSTHGLVHDVVRKLKSDSPTLDLIGDAPGSCKPLAFVGDTANAILYFALTKDHMTFPFNVSPPDSISVQRVAEVCMEELGIRKPVKWLGWAVNWKGDSPVVNVKNGASIRSGFRYRYRTSETGLRAALQDIKRE